MDRPILTTGNHISTIWAKDNATNPAAMAVKGIQQPTCAHVPHLHRPVPAAAGQDRATGVNGNGHDPAALSSYLKGLWFNVALVVVDPPQANYAVLAGTG
jgi:hypothetical protein